ncbi:MAG: type II toxin-antitoxin system antitoxin SocA domain-containing protein [Bacteroidota bacterium]
MKENKSIEGREMKHESIKLVFRKEEFEVWQAYYIDPDTGNEFTDKELDRLAMQQAHNQYREQHHIPFPDEILKIRQRYGLSASKMSEVLDLGANSYRNYEHGEVPSLANAKLIRLAANPENFLRFVKEKQHAFSPNGYKKVLTKIDSLMEEDRLSKVVEYIWNFHMEANAYTGYVKPSFEKVAQFVLFFAQQDQPLKTRLNKLLFYSDFLHFKRTGFSISGCNYRAIPFGPVPSHFHELFGVLQTEDYIKIEEELFDHGGVGERFLPSQTFDPSLFSEEELQHMNEVVKAFKDTRTRELIEISHAEKGWIDNQNDRNLISYQDYAFALHAMK